MQVDELLDQMMISGNRLVTAAGLAGPDHVVPTCPGWTISDLVAHTSRVHAWAAHVVRGRSPESFAPEPVAPAELLDHFRRGLDVVGKSIRSAREPAEGGGRPPGGSRAFWARRMTHETTIHWLDAEIAADTGMVDVPTAVAADGLDELLLGFAASSFATIEIDLPVTITVMPLDVNRAWTISATAHGVRSADVATDRADLTVSGLSADLYRWAWNRGRDDEVSLSGMVELAGVWHRNFVVADRR